MCGESCTHGVEPGKSWRLYQRLTYGYPAPMLMCGKVTHKNLIDSLHYSEKLTKKKAKLNLIIDIIAKIWYYKTKGDDANGLMKHTTKYNFLSKGGSP